MGSYVSVDIYVVDDTPLAKPVEGVLVRVFDEKNIYFHNQDTTDVDGRVGFTLFTNIYNLRFFKFGAQVKQPQIIEVTASLAGTPQLNAFEVKATVFQHPVANDARLCRASGFFRDVTGAPQRFLDVHIIGQFAPILLEGAGVLSERRAIRTDADGFAWLDLIRFAKYTATIQGFEDTQREILVPDAPSVNLPDLLFPVVEEVALEPEGPYTLVVGQSLELTPVVLTSSGVPLSGTAPADVIWSSSDSIFSLDIASDKLVLKGLAKGSAELRAERRNKTIIRIPDSAIGGVPQVITIT